MLDLRDKDMLPRSCDDRWDQFMVLDLLPRRWGPGTLLPDSEKFDVFLDFARGRLRALEYVSEKDWSPFYPTDRSSGFLMTRLDLFLLLRLSPKCKLDKIVLRNNWFVKVTVWQEVWNSAFTEPSLCQSFY